MPGESGSGGADKPLKDPDVRDELLADGTMVLFQPSTRQIVTLNRAAALVWESCDGAHSRSDIVTELSAIFPETPTIEHDVEVILHDLHARGVLRDED